MKIYFDAKSRLPEFSGLQGRRFPGQQSPQPPSIAPRRPPLPADLSDKWSKIGSRRYNKTIFVTPAE